MKKAHVAFTLILMASFFLHGCATTSQKTTTDHFNSRIKMLEDNLHRKDAEIASLRNKNEQLSREISEKDRTIKTLAPAPKPVTTTKDAIGIIRVDATVEQVQTALKNAGYYDGNVDGKIGPRTINAIASFQKDNGLTQDSIIGQKTWERLQKFLK